MVLRCNPLSLTLPLSLSLALSLTLPPSLSLSLSLSSHVAGVGARWQEGKMAARNVRRIHGWSDGENRLCEQANEEFSCLLSFGCICSTFLRLICLRHVVGSTHFQVAYTDIARITLAACLMELLRVLVADRF